MKLSTQNVIVGFVCLIALYGIGSVFSSSGAQPKQRKPVPVLGDFQSKTYSISDHEHIVAFDIPDRYIPNRCWTYVNEKTNTSNMHCDTSDETAPLPTQGPDIDR